MPIYEYRCHKGHTFEVLQRMTDDAVELCEECEAPVERVLHPVAVHFKGSGFYHTDYGKSKAKSGAGEATKEAASGTANGKSKTADGADGAKRTSRGGDSAPSDSSAGADTKAAAAADR